MPKYDLGLPYVAFFLAIGVLFAALGGAFTQHVDVEQLDDPIAQRLFACSMITINVQSSCISQVMVDTPD